MAGVTVRNVRKVFAGGVVALDGVTLEVPDGSFVSVLGPSGSGKTTLLRIVAGLESPTSGSVEIGGEVVDDRERGLFVPAEDRKIGMVFQNYALWPHMTIWENVEFPLVVQGVAAADRARRVREVLEVLDIAGLGKRYPWQVSGGQQQRVALARAMVAAPRVLLLDEPLANLDAQLRTEMRAELKRLHQRWRNTVIYVTHDQLEAMSLSNLVAVMREGRLEQVGEPVSVYGRPRNKWVAEFIGSPKINVLPIGGTGGRLGELLGEWLERRIGRAQARRVCEVGIRPEAIRIGGGADRDAFVAGARVEVAMFTGPSWVLELRWVDRRVFAMSLDGWWEGERDCWVRPEDLVLFDAGGGRIEGEVGPGVAEEAGAAT